MQMTTSSKVINIQSLYFIEGESNAAKIEIVLPKSLNEVELAGLHYTLLGVSDKDTSVEQVLPSRVETDGKVILTWEPDARWAMVAGSILLELRGQDDTGGVVIKWKSDRAILVQQGLKPGGQPAPDIIQQLLDEMRRLLVEAQAQALLAELAANRAEQAATRAEQVSVTMPYVGDDGYWYTWDNNTGTFVKTNVPKAHSHPMEDVAGLSSELAKIPTTESGTWTPKLGAGATCTYALQEGTYYLVGNVLNASGKIILSSKGNLTGAITVSGFPYLPAARVIAPVLVDKTSPISSYYPANAAIANKDGFLTVCKQAPTAYTALNASEILDNLEISFSVNYEIA